MTGPARAPPGPAAPAPARPAPRNPLPSRTRALGLAAVLLAGLAAGCTGPAPPAGFEAHGGSPTVYLGYDYEGFTAQPSEGAIAIQVDPATDEGTVVATFALDGRAWRVQFTDFLERAPFHQGGIRNDFPEHGASGNGDALLPAFTALSAGWGVGTATVDGAPFADPVTGNGTLALHYMVAEQAPRDPATRRVTKADGTTPYDPATPGDARVVEGTRQILLNVQTPPGTLPADQRVRMHDNVTGPAYTAAGSFPVNASAASAALNITVTNHGPAPTPPVGTLTVVVVNPDGQEVGRWDYDPGQAAGSGTGTGSMALQPPLVVGTYTVRIESTVGVALGFAIDVLVDYPDALFLHVVYEDVRVGPPAA